MRVDSRRPRKRVLSADPKFRKSAVAPPRRQEYQRKPKSQRPAACKRLASIDRASLGRRFMTESPAARPFQCKRTNLKMSRSRIVTAPRWPFYVWRSVTTAGHASRVMSPTSREQNSCRTQKAMETAGKADCEPRLTYVNRHADETTNDKFRKRRSLQRQL